MVVCDSIMECEGWRDGWKIVLNLISNYAIDIMLKNIDKRFNKGKVLTEKCEIISGTYTVKDKVWEVDLPIDPFMYCPWCGKELDWINWPRLKGGG